MPTPGKALIGFMAEAAAVEFLQSTCVADDPDNVAKLSALWQEARAGLGPAVPRAGTPEILPIPDSHAAYIEALKAQAWVDHALKNNIASATFGLVEIAPLLAFQFQVDDHRSKHHCAPFGTPPTLDELLLTCLPQVPVPDPVVTQQQPNSMLLVSRSLNFHGIQAGLLPGNIVGLAVGFSLPLVHVVRFNGRCYLHNGFHRTYGAAAAGAKHIPCVIRDVAAPDLVGINPPRTFDLALMESDNPPTLGHFIDGRATDVQLRAYTRTVHVTWNEYVVPAE